MRLLPVSKLKKQLSNIILSVILAAGLIEPFLFAAPAQAAFTFVEYRPDRMAAATAPTGVVCAKTATSGTESTMTITFPSSYTVDSTTSNWTLDTTATNIPSGTTQWPSTTSGNASNVSGQAVTFTVGDLSSGATTYCLHFTAGGTSVSGSAANDLTGSIATDIDSAKSYAVSLVTAGNEQISVTATVPPTFTFSLSTSSQALGTLSSSTTTSGSGSTLTISTNATNGWQAWMKSANGELSSSSTSDNISAGTYQTGSGNIVDLASTTGYVVDVNTGSGTPTIDAAFNGSNTTSGGVPATNFAFIATKGTPGASDTVSIVPRAKPSATNKAATDYTDTLTITAAGQF